MNKRTDKQVPEENIIDMVNIINQLQEAEENAPSKSEPIVIEKIKQFMETLTFHDCENFAREVRRMMDDVSEIRMKQEKWHKENPFSKEQPPI